MARGNDNMKGRIALFEICGESSRVILRESQVLGENHCVFGGDMEWMMGGEEGPVVDGRLSQSAFGFSSASGNICAKHVPRQLTVRAKGIAGNRKRSRAAAL